jgi:uncharacterized protein YdeI (BOF family)|tara:strand:+ start:387 stop:590 length:204 start_codon:yes stop_codon:yes gene_type:complete
MKKGAIILSVFLIIGLFFVAGCSVDGGNSQQPQQQYGGGGCGVGAPSDSGNSEETASDALEEPLNNL